MRLFLLFLLITISHSIFAEEFTFKENVLMKVNGIEHRLKNINDSRCKEVCVWEGRIYVDLKIKDKKHNFAFFPDMHFEEKQINRFTYKIKNINLESRKATFEINKVEK